MTPYNTAIHALGVPAGLTLEDTGTYEMLFMRDAYTPDLTDTGHAFESNLGANISHREVIPTPTWVNRVFGASDFPITDPNNGDTVTKIVVVKTANGAGGAGGGGTAATNRVIAYQLLSTPRTWDGTNDTFDVNASGLFRIGAA